MHPFFQAFLAVLALVLVGSVSLSRLPVALLPDVTLPMLTVRTDYAGAAATEVSRFVAEARAAARLLHPHVVPIFDVGHHESFHFFAMEFVDGTTVRGDLEDQFTGGE